jgi:hypothetical protein
MFRGPGFVLAAGAIARAPAISAHALRAHDAAVRRLAAGSRALLPFRFGAVAAGPEELLERLPAASGAVRDALALVAGREQMTLRLSGRPARRPRPPPGPPGGPGARYLLRRARHDPGQPGLPELAPLRAALARVVVAERLEGDLAGGALRATVYHLIPRGRAPEYRRIVRTVLAGAPPLGARLSGPWPPYAFAAGIVA